MDATLKPRLRLLVTPELLRSWADICERRWKNVKLGESIAFHELMYKDVDIELCFDQDEMHRLDKGR